jgi:hypothetical protein
MHNGEGTGAAKQHKQQKANPTKPSIHGLGLGFQVEEKTVDARSGRSKMNPNPKFWFLPLSPLCPRLLCVRQREEEKETSSLAMDFVVHRFVGRIQIQAVDSCSDSTKSAHVTSFCTFPHFFGRSRFLMIYFRDLIVCQRFRVWGS